MFIRKVICKKSNNIGIWLYLHWCRSLATYFMGSFLYDTVMDADDDIITQWLQLQEGRGKEEYCANKIFRYE